jgi:hypothetical protein
MGVFAASSPAETVARATDAANVLKQVITQAGLIAKIGGKDYLTVEAWTTLGVMCGVTARTQWSREIDGGWEAAVEVVNANGLVIGRAEAECLRSERNWQKRDDYAIRSMAQTRAMGKALRMPLGWIAVLAGYEATPAEEMPANGPVSERVAQKESSGQAVTAETLNQLEAALAIVSWEEAWWIDNVLRNATRKFGREITDLAELTEDQAQQILAGAIAWAEANPAPEDAIVDEIPEEIEF